MGRSVYGCIYATKMYLRSSDPANLTVTYCDTSACHVAIRTIFFECVEFVQAELKEYIIIIFINGALVFALNMN